MLIILIHNDGTGTNENANYTYEVKVNERVLDCGIIKGHKRWHGWRMLLRELVDASFHSEVVINDYPNINTLFIGE